jgi:hypothetical protein
MYLDESTEGSGAREAWVLEAGIMAGIMVELEAVECASAGFGTEPEVV